MPNPKLPIHELSHVTTTTTPQDVEWDSEDYVNDEWCWWEARQIDGPDEYDGDGEFHQIYAHSSVVAVFLPDGTRIDSGEEQDYVDEHSDDDGTLDEGAFTLEQIEELFEDGQHYPEGPMMNYWYPIDGADRSDVGPYRNKMDAVHAAYLLRDTCLVVVEREDNIGLALSGGGMDLSWEICEAFMTLGYLPPAHFADLPGMAGRGDSADDRRIVDACEQTFMVQQERAGYALDRLRKKYPNPTT